MTPGSQILVPIYFWQHWDYFKEISNEGDELGVARRFVEYANRVGVGKYTEHEVVRSDDRTVGISILVHGLTALWGSNRYADWYAGQSGEPSRMLENHDVSEFPARGRLGHPHPGYSAQE